MGISHAQPLLLLLVSLFFSPALCGPFKTCSSRHQYPITVNSVEISPDPVELSGNGNISITGVTNKEIVDGVTVYLKLAKGIATISTKKYSLCDITACPVAPGPIVLNFSNIFTPLEKSTATEYTVIIRIASKSPRETLMCIVLPCKLTDGYASLLRQVTG